jgi:hypothetical protein
MTATIDAMKAAQTYAIDKTHRGAVATPGFQVEGREHARFPRSVR